MFSDLMYMYKVLTGSFLKASYEKDAQKMKYFLFINKLLQSKWFRNIYRYDSNEVYSQRCNIMKLEFCSITLAFFTYQVCIVLFNYH